VDEKHKRTTKDRARFSFMVVLRSKLSGYYFKDFGIWTSNPADARAFDSEWSARAFAICEHVQDVQFVEREIPILDLSLAA